MGLAFSIFLLLYIIHNLIRNCWFIFYRENYVFLQVGFQHLAYEMREDVPGYEAESLFGKENYILGEMNRGGYLLLRTNNSTHRQW